MRKFYKKRLTTPAVYIQEISTLSTVVKPVPTTIPAFIGYTRNITEENGSLINRPVRITSLHEYESLFGVRLETFTVEVDTDNSSKNIIVTSPSPPTTFYRMYYALQMYFANGGGPCFIISIGADSDPPSMSDFRDGLTAAEKEDEPSLLVLPDIHLLDRQDFYQIYQDALAQCRNRGDRFLICDVFNGYLDYTSTSGENVIDNASTGFRTLIGNNHLSYGAAYYPHLETTLSFLYEEEAVTIQGNLDGNPVPEGMVLRIRNPAGSVDQARSLYHRARNLYREVKNKIGQMPLILPPGPAIAGVYAAVDATRGVWKAPANVSISQVRHPTVGISDPMQKNLNSHATGKSINAIRTFPGRGILVWGARTLDGNSSEWRYVQVRRFIIMVEESIRKAMDPFVFEPNNAVTWGKVKSMIANFLMLHWRAGALLGNKPDLAYFVKAGLGETMTHLDILEGRMIIEMGLAAVRPAEFIILRIQKNMLAS